MCGIVGIAGFMPVNQSIYDALTVLQHRGQDAAGIVTIDALNCFRLRKANGLVSDVFEARHMQRLQGNMGIGHVRYPTAGSSSASEAQPFYVNSPYGITLQRIMTEVIQLAGKDIEQDFRIRSGVNVAAFFFKQLFTQLVGIGQVTVMRQGYPVRRVDVERLYRRFHAGKPVDL